MSCCNKNYQGRFVVVVVVVVVVVILLLSLYFISSRLDLSRNLIQI